MMVGVPFLIAVLAGSVVLWLTSWFRKKRLSLMVRILPGILTIVIAIVLFYIGFINVRGFEGAAYGFLAFFLSGFSIAALIMAIKTPRFQKEGPHIS